METQQPTAAIPGCLVVLLAVAMQMAVGCGAVRSDAVPIRIFAASSLGDALQDLAPACEAATGTRLKVVLGSSQALARQISAGAPADIVLAADVESLDALTREGRLRREAVIPLLSNVLALVVPANEPLTLSDSQALTVWLRGLPRRGGGGRIALGDPAMVPAGRYARDYLQRLGVWSEVEARALPCESVRAALAAVASGNALAGFVYATDVPVESRVRLAFQVSRDEGPQIVYPAAVVSGSAQPEAAARVLRWLSGEDAWRVWRSRGFIKVAPGRNAGD